MGSSRIKPLTVKELYKLTSAPPRSIKHYGLGGVPGFVPVHTPADYVGFALVYRHEGKRKKLTLGGAKKLTLADARKMAAKYRSDIEAGLDPHGEKVASRMEKIHRVRLDPLRYGKSTWPYSGASFGRAAKRTASSALYPAED
jgi:hypothetical protein